MPKVLLPFALHGLAREIDGAVGTLLHTTLDLPDFAVQALRLLDPARALPSVLCWIAVGAAVWGLLAWARARRSRLRLAEALEAARVPAASGARRAADPGTSGRSAAGR